MDRLLLVGDSITKQIAPYFAERYPAVDVRWVGADGIGPLTAQGRIADLVQEAVAEFDPDVVLFEFAGSYTKKRGGEPFRLVRRHRGGGRHRPHVRGLGRPVPAAGPGGAGQGGDRALGPRPAGRPRRLLQVPRAEHRPLQRHLQEPAAAWCSSTGSRPSGGQYTPQLAVGRPRGARPGPATGCTSRPSATAASWRRPRRRSRRTDGRYRRQRRPDGPRLRLTRPAIGWRAGSPDPLPFPGRTRPGARHRPAPSFASGI